MDEHVSLDKLPLSGDRRDSMPALTEAIRRLASEQGAARREREDLASLLKSLHDRFEKDRDAHEQRHEALLQRIETIEKQPIFDAEKMATLAAMITLAQDFAATRRIGVMIGGILAGLLAAGTAIFGFMAAWKAFHGGQ